MAINVYLSIIFLKLNELNAAIKRHRMVEWIKKAQAYFYAACNRLVSGLGTHLDWKWRGGKNTLANGNKKKPEVTIFISNNIRL